jgi:rhodanese-related sulfurtransferase
MQRLIEFAGNHPYLVAAAVLLLVAVIVTEMRARIQEFAALNPVDAIRLMNQGAAVIDVRNRAEFDAGHISEARNIPLAEIAGSTDSLKKYREKPVITCCDTGMSGGNAARELSKLGFTKVFNLRGGLAAWRRASLPLVRSEKKGGEKSLPRT